MAQLLSQASALNPGHDLWVTPDNSGSRWALRLDWYLNFQISKAGRHDAAEMDANLTQILSEVEWPSDLHGADAKSPLLVPCNERLPARWVAVVPSTPELIDWVARVETLWSGLGKPSLKVFLPTGLQAGTFTEEWKRRVGADDFSVVLD